MKEKLLSIQFRGSLYRGAHGIVKSIISPRGAVFLLLNSLLLSCFPASSILIDMNQNVMIGNINIKRFDDARGRRGSKLRRNFSV
jgi:hypothetical protein